jgi:hypothetical protein
VQLNYLHQTDDYQVIWFHDSFQAFASVCGELDRRTYLIYSFSWYAQPQRLGRTFEGMARAIAQSPTPQLDPHRIMFMMNSSAEFSAANQIANFLRLPFRISHVNNACFLDPEVYDINPAIEKRFSAVCNSKPAYFKRHWLSEKVENKIFITYDRPDRDYGAGKTVDLTRFNPIEIFWDVSDEEVVRLLNGCKVGLIFSEEEGACYASLEYLLCGLPVISTESRGGRSEYYTSENSIVVAPDATEVAIAVERMLRKIEQGTIDARAIRRGAIRRAQESRSRFLSDLSDLLAHEKNRDVAVDRIRGLLSKHSKMAGFRNF